MRFVCIADTHNLHSKITLPKGDVLIVAGDICSSGRINQVTSFSYWLDKWDFKYKIIISGNHDMCLMHNSYVSFSRGVSYLCDKPMYIRIGYPQDLFVYGMPWCPEFGNWAFMLPRDGFSLKRKVDLIPDQTDILITHTAPFGILDDTEDNEHAGCRLLREKVDKIMPKIHIFGHFHGGYGTYQNHKTLFVNCSICNNQYDPINKPIVIDYIDNSFKVVDNV